MGIEDNGNFKDAEDHFFGAKTPKEAVLMYAHNQDWDSAQIVAKEHNSISVHDVPVDQERVAFDAKDLAKFEFPLLRTQGQGACYLSWTKFGAN